MRTGRPAKLTVPKLLELLAKHGNRRTPIRAALRINRKTLSSFIQRARKLGYEIPDDPDYVFQRGYQVEPNPTPEEIRAMCAELRKSWGPERLRRYEAPPVVLLTARAAYSGRSLAYEVSEI